MMIAASEPQEFVPFGRQQLLNHPKVVHISDNNHHQESTLLNRFSQVAITDSSQNKESWILRKTENDGVECEEELYFKDRTVVWSIGPASVDNRTNRVLKCCYTCETPVQEAIFCNFHLSTPDFPSTFFGLNPPKNIPFNISPGDESNNLKNCICILNALVIKTYAKTGQEFVTTLQFQIQKIWPIKYGILVERRVNKESNETPLNVKKKMASDLRRQSIEQSFLQKGSFSFMTLPVAEPATPSESLPEHSLFSLSHPLDEFCPVTAQSESSSYVTKPDYKIIFTSENPSMCLTYDRKTGLHAIYLIRKALPHETEMCWRRDPRLSRRSSFNSGGRFSGSGSNSFNFDQDNRTIPAFLSARTRKSLGLGTTTFPNVQTSPTPSFEARTSSPIPSRAYGSTSPLFGFPHFTPNSKKGDSCQSSFTGTPSRFENRMMSENVEYTEPKPVFPQVCLQCLWSENHDLKGYESNGEASRAFLSTDIMGQKYICYLVQLKLHLLKLEEKNDEDFQIIGDPTFVQAKDASPLEARNMIAVIGLDGGVELYTGHVHVAKILISGVASSIATSSYLSDFNAGPTFFTKPSPGAFPKRSSLIPQAAPLDSPTFNDSLSQFSPVMTCTGLTPTLPVTREGALIALKDNVGGRISLEYTSALLFRLELPHFGNSPLVEAILSVLTSVLPRPVVLQFFIKWFSTRNAPGCYHLSLQEEFYMFSNLLYSSLGYDVEALRGSQMDQTSPVTRPKKQRTSELQSDEDWAALIGSQHHLLAANRLPHLNLTAMQLRPIDFPSSLNNIDTPLASGRSANKLQDASSTPIITDKPKRSVLAKKETTQTIDETPMVPKPSYGKSRIPSSRFQKSLESEVGTPSFEKEVQQQANTSCALRNKKALLNPHFPLILHALHLLYEDLKLNTLRSSEREQLVPILYQLARDMGCDSLVHHYWADAPSLFQLIHVPSMRPEAEALLSGPVPSIFRHLNDIVQRKTHLRPYPFLPGVNEHSRKLIEVFGLMSFEAEKPSAILKNVLANSNVSEDIDKSLPGDPAHRVVVHLTNIGITIESLQTLPAGVTFTIYDALYRCRDTPGSNWSIEAYILAERRDLASIYNSPQDRKINSSIRVKRKTGTVQPENGQEDDGMEELSELDMVKLRWASDQRVIELRRMLQSAFPVRIAIQQRPEVSDHEFLQEQERHLYAICARTMALPIARGMVTLGCSTPVITEKLPIPLLCLTGKVPPSDKVIEMTHIEIPSTMNDWPLFHNGVAAGLRISAEAINIDSEWIIYNKPKGNAEEQIEHAGFLMALGLNGHLKNLVDLTIYMYLVKCHEMTKVGLMLGLAVSKRGTMDVHTIRIVSVHIEAMLPPTGIEMDIDVMVEPAALMALGFLYQGTAHRHISQVLIQEIGRLPGPEMENSVDRESYSLAAGLALGLVVFGRGNSLAGLADMTIADTLYHFMVGGPKRPYLGSQRDKYKTPSYLILEGSLVNTHVTGPGATLALGMLYFNTGNKAVAEWLKVPETQHLLETVLPDALLLRTLAKSLILWTDIVPSREWVLSHVPDFVLPHCLVKPTLDDDSAFIDYETMNQAYCNIVAGACMSIGLRFAGSAHEDAFETLMYFAVKFSEVLGKSIAELCGRATVETCLNVITVSLGMVMAGTGHLEVMRLCRYLRSRVGPSNSVVTYGSHLATHMALGLLFLGAGSLTLSTSPDAIAALLCAFYPKWPICSSDNRYHLQAFRHLYVLAVEPRLLLPRDIDTRTPCYVHVTYIYLDDSIYLGKAVRLLAPCLLPELNLLKEVRLDDDRYWSITFTAGENWEQLQKILACNSFVDVKRRAGFLSYIDDPQGFRSLLAQTLTSNDTIPWGVRPPSIFLFSSNPILENFLNFFFDNKSDQAGEAERKTLSAVTDFCYFCLTKDKLPLLPHWLSLIKLTQTLSTRPTVDAVWQWKLVLSQSQRSSNQLMPPDVALSVKQDILSLLTSWEPGVIVQTKDYLLGNFESQGLHEGRVAAYLTFHEIPFRGNIDFKAIMQGDMSSAITILGESGASPEAIVAILSLLEF